MITSSSYDSRPRVSKHKISHNFPFDVSFMHAFSYSYKHDKAVLATALHDIEPS